jgi:hypothetical protein
MHKSLASRFRTWSHWRHVCIKNLSSGSVCLVGQDCILRAGFVTRASLRRLQIGAQVENLPHEAN